MQQPLDFSPIANAPLAAMQAAAYGDALQANRLQNRLAGMAAAEDQRKKSVAGLVAESLYGARQQAAPQGVTNQLAPQPQPSAQQPSGMDPLIAFQQKESGVPGTEIMGQMAQVPGGTAPTNQLAPAAPAAPAADPYTQQRIRLRDLYNSGKITAEEAQAYDQQITTAEQASRATRSTPKLAFYKDMMGKAAEAGDNETFQALAKQAQSDPDVKGMIPNTTSLQVTGRQQVEVTKPFTAQEIAGIAAKHPELGITPDTTPGLYKLTTKGGVPVGWEPKEPPAPKGPEVRSFDGIVDDLRKKNPTWDKGRLDFEAGKIWDARKVANSQQRTKFTFDLKNGGMGGEDDGFKSYTPEMKEQAFKDRQLGTYKYPTGMKSLPEKQAFDKEYYHWRVTGKVDAIDVTTDRAVAAGNKAALQELTKREQLIGTFTHRIDATSGVIEAAFNRLGNTDARLRNISINKLKHYMGDGDLRALKLAIKSLSNEVAKVESGSIGIGEVSVSQAAYMEKVHDLETLSLDDAMKIINMGKELGKTSMQSIKIQREDLVKEMRTASVGGKEPGGKSDRVPLDQASMTKVVNFTKDMVANYSRAKVPPQEIVRRVAAKLRAGGYTQAEMNQIIDAAEGK